MLINTSITRSKGQFSQSFEPPLSLYVKQAIGAARAVNLDLSNACAGMLTGVFLLQDLISRGEIDCGMVVSGEYISNLSWNAAKQIRSLFSKQLASLTLGDAGAAVIVERVPGGSGIDVIGYLIPHQTSARAIRAGTREFVRCLGARPKHVVVNLEEYGNTSSTTLFVALHKYLEEQRIRKGDRVMLLALASGIEIGIAIFTVDSMVDRYGNSH